MLGLAIAVALRHWTNLPHVISALGLLAGFLISSLAWRVLKGPRNAMPMADVLSRNRGVLEKWNIFYSIAEQLCQLVVVVGTIIFLSSNLTVSEWAAFSASHSYLFLGLVGIFLLAAAFSGSQQKRRIRRVLAQANRDPPSAIAARTAKWKPALYGIAAILFMLGCMATFAASRFPWASIAGLFSSALILCGLWAASVTHRMGSQKNIFQTAIIGGLFFWGIPMGIFFWALGVIEFLARSGIRHTPVVEILARMPKFLLGMTPTVFAIAEAGGLGFGLFIGLYSWIWAPLASDQRH
ncbi:MAG TPA: hypothetical protein VHX61_13510 [Rhizomicrobium sp.]|nr:hypothetical protein [Rhizomicrobium sp.]